MPGLVVFNLLRKHKLSFLPVGVITDELSLACFCIQPSSQPSCGGDNFV
jgi:hypothetical protein